MAHLETSILSHELTAKRWVPILVAGALSGAVAGALVAYISLRPRTSPDSTKLAQSPQEHHLAKPNSPQSRSQTSQHVLRALPRRMLQGHQGEAVQLPIQRTVEQLHPDAELEADAEAKILLATPSRPRSSKRSRLEEMSAEAVAHGATDKLGGGNTTDLNSSAGGPLVSDAGGGALDPFHSPLQASGRRDPTDPAPRSGSLSWDDYFMALAFLSAKRSKDPNKQVGAVIVNCDNVILAIGYNGFPRGCCDSELPWAKEARSPCGRPNPLGTKYPYVVHAEANALLNKNAASVAGARIYVTMFPCNECAKLLIQAGVREVVYHEDKVLHLEGNGHRHNLTAQHGPTSQVPGSASRADAAVEVEAPPSAGYQQRAERLQLHQKLQRARWLESGAATTTPPGSACASPPAVFSPCVPLYDGSASGDDDGDSDEDEGWSAMQKCKQRQVGAGSAGSASLTSLATATSTATTAAAVAGSQPAAMTPSTATRCPSPASRERHSVCTSATVGDSCTDADGAPWSGFWSDPRLGATAPLSTGNSVCQLANAGAIAAPSSGQILSFWARVTPPALPADVAGSGPAPDCNPSVVAAEVGATLTRSGCGGLSVTGDTHGEAGRLTSAVDSADVCYMASLRMLRLAGVKLRQHRLQRLITIQGPGATS